MGYLWIYLFDPFPLVILLGLVEFQPPFLTPFYFFLVSVMILMVFVGAELAEANIACPDPCATPKGRPSSICCTPRGAVGEISGAVGPSHGIQHVETWRFRFDTNMKTRHKYILHVAPDVSVTDLLTDFLSAPITHLKADIQWKTPWFTAGRSAGWPWSSPPPMVPWRDGAVKWQGPRREKTWGQGS